MVAMHEGAVFVLWKKGEVGQGFEGSIYRYGRGFMVSVEASGIESVAMWRVMYCISLSVVDEVRGVGSGTVRINKMKDGSWRGDLWCEQLGDGWVHSAERREALWRRVRAGVELGLGMWAQEIRVEDRPALEVVEW